MWSNVRSRDGECQIIAMHLEEAAQGLPQAATHEQLLSAIPEDAKEHLRACPDCFQGIEDFLQSRKLLAALERNPGDLGNPFFEKRVMAAIAAREAQLEGPRGTWAFVPKLASRLAGVATIVLVVAGTWLYSGPARRQANQPALENGTQLFEDNSAVPASRDDILVSLLERSE
jgi:hypothetical protein